MTKVKVINPELIFKPEARFIKTESLGGVVLIVFAVIALIIANSPLYEVYHHFFETNIQLGYGAFSVSKPLHYLINDGLMTIFFFVVGLEIKREVLVGELSGLKKALFPILAAVGGMIVPISLFLLFNMGNEGSAGWGIPMATDIAFSLGILSLLGKRVPLSLKVFLTAFAIVDDLGAVLVIAFFYSSGIAWTPLLLALGIVVLLFVFGKLNVHAKWVYIVAGIAVWVLFLQSGVHATIAGVLVALAIPANPRISMSNFSENIRENLKAFCSDPSAKGKVTLTKKQLECIDNIEDAALKVQSPQQAMEHGLHKFTTFFIMPLFAFANAGVKFGNMSDGLFQGLSLSVMLALIFGKFIGIYLFSWLSVRTKISDLPMNMDFKNLAGLALLGGVGFTMSLFIGSLSFASGDLLNQAKAGVLIGSLVAGLAGFLVLRATLAKPTS